jgi:hypothetical protein
MDEKKNCSSIPGPAVVVGLGIAFCRSFQDQAMISSRLFHTVIIVGAALALGATVGCSGDDGSPSPSTDSQTNEPVDADGGAEAGTDRGWAPTK